MSQQTNKTTYHKNDGRMPSIFGNKCKPDQCEYQTVR